MLTSFLRAMILYIVMIVVIRALGRRQLGQFQPYEFAMTILIADILSTPMGSVSTPLLHGLLPVAAMVVVHCAITLICMKSDTVRAIISGKPSLVISKGIIDDKELKRLCMSLSDLLEGLRSAGILDPADVGTAVIEPNGVLSAFPRSSMRPPNTSEMGIDAGYEGLPMILVMDGRIQEHNLIQSGKDEKWLRGQLSGFGADVDDVYFAYIDTKGLLSVQKRGGGLESKQAIDSGEVRW